MKIKSNPSALNVFKNYLAIIYFYFILEVIILCKRLIMVKTFYFLDLRTLSNERTLIVFKNLFF